MCLAVPARLLEIKDNGMGVADHAGNRRDVSLLLLEDAEVGDYVIIHAGFAIHKIDEEAARQTIEYLDSLSTQLPPGYDPNSDF